MIQKLMQPNLIHIAIHLRFLLDLILHLFVASYIDINILNVLSN